MSSVEVLTVPPESINTLSIFERDPTYRHESVRQLLYRLFPHTLHAVRQIEGMGSDNFDDHISDFHLALKVISMREPPHFPLKTKDNNDVQVSAIEGLYSVFRNLVLETMFKGRANRGILERLAGAWCTTMRVLMVYEETCNNRTLKNICEKSRDWLQTCLIDSVDEHITWPFWKAVKAGLNWCCMFHPENDNSCLYGSPRLGRLLTALEDDRLMDSVTQSLTSYTYGPYLAVRQLEHSDSEGKFEDDMSSGSGNLNVVLNNREETPNISQAAESSAEYDELLGNIHDSHKIFVNRLCLNNKQCRDERYRDTYRNVATGMQNQEMEGNVLENGRVINLSEVRPPLYRRKQRYWGPRNEFGPGFFDRPVAIVKPCCTWIEYDADELPEELFDGPPFGELLPLSRADIRIGDTRAARGYIQNPIDSDTDTDEDEDDEPSLPRILNYSTGTIDTVALAEIDRQEQIRNQYRLISGERDSRRTLSPSTSIVPDTISTSRNESEISHRGNDNAEVASLRPRTSIPSRTGRTVDRRRNRPSRSRSTGNERDSPFANRQVQMSDYDRPGTSGIQRAVANSIQGDTSSTWTRSPVSSVRTHRYIWEDGEVVMVSDVDDE